MEIIIIAAVSHNDVIGNKGKTPWHIPEDLKHFRKLTLFHPVIMGRKTYETLGKPLDKRVNIIVTNNPDFKPERTIVCHSIEEAIEKARDYDETAYIIGGSQIYQQTIGLADRLEITRVHKYVNGKMFFPEINPRQWDETAREDHNDYSFHTYKRIKEK